MTKPNPQATAQDLAEACAAALAARDDAVRALAIELVQINPRRAVMRMTVRQEMTNGHDVCHGGVIFTLADAAFAYACNSYNQSSVAAGASIEFVAPAAPGEVLTATAEQSVSTGRTSHYDVRVTNGAGATIALFRGRSSAFKGQSVV